MRRMKLVVEYKGYVAEAYGEDDNYYYVWAYGTKLPDGLFLDMEFPGRFEYRGKILKDSPELRILDDSGGT